MADGPTARVDGLLPHGRNRAEPVDLFPGQVWSVGRRDIDYLRSDAERARWHLAVPGARPDLSVNELELRVGAVGVAVSSRRGAGVLVDGVVRPGPVVLTQGTSFISPTVAGLHLDFALTVVRTETFAAREGALASSGTTLTLRLEIECDTALWHVAHALAWPVMPTRRRPHAAGWSGRDVAERLSQLGRPIEAPDQRAAITVLGKHLLALADRVTNCRLADGRRVDTVLPMWPPWLEGDDDSQTRDQRAERRNRCVADVLWRAGAVDAAVIDGR